MVFPSSSMCPMQYFLPIIKLEYLLHNLLCPLWYSYKIKLWEMLHRPKYHLTLNDNIFPAQKHSSTYQHECFNNHITDKNFRIRSFIVLQWWQCMLYSRAKYSQCNSNWNLNIFYKFTTYIHIYIQHQKYANNILEGSIKYVLQ